jgi:hypothetical protein
MAVTSKTLSIIAYYLSEYDLNAVRELGFRTRNEAFKKISVYAGRDNNYLKLRRDEFDALPESSSHRNGWRNRAPVKEVIEMAAYLRTFSFKELTDIVKALIANFDSFSTSLPTISYVVKTDSISEEELEQIINFSDPDATIELVTKSLTRRICDISIIHRLKKLYKGQCQICGHKPFEAFDSNICICEAHHIEHFSESQNNDACNIIVICPNHHRLIHRLLPVFDRENMTFISSKGTLPIQIDYHLK